LHKAQQYITNSILFVSFGFLGCTAPSPEKIHKDQYDPKTLLRLACSIGNKIQTLHGELRIKIESDNANFSAPIQLAMQNQILIIDILDPLGNPQANLKFSNNTLEIKNFRDGSIKKGLSEWNGLPLRWAQVVFSGRIPCPNHFEKLEKEISYGPNNELIVKIPADLSTPEQTFIYTFSRRLTDLWPSEVQWMLQDIPKLQATFHFDSTMERWDINWQKAGSKGLLKAKWLNRKINPS
jgi:hypothetical protein